MAYFYSYLPLLQQVEGRFQKLPQDPGNFNSRGELVGTNYGISARFYEGLIGRPPTEADMRAITKDQAQKIFLDHFWNAQKADQINSQAMANTIIDHQINAGDGVRLAQLVLNSRFGYNLSTDNRMGPLTLAALNRVEAARFITIYNEERAKHYRGIGNSTFQSGWLTRLAKFAVDYQRPISLITVVAVAAGGYLFYNYVLKA